MSSVSFEFLRLVASLTLSKRSFFCQLLLTLKSVHSTCIAGGFFIYITKGGRIKTSAGITYILQVVKVIIQKLFCRFFLSYDKEEYACASDECCTADCEHHCAHTTGLGNYGLVVRNCSTVYLCYSIVCFNVYSEY